MYGFDNNCQNSNLEVISADLLITQLRQEKVKHTQYRFRIYDKSVSGCVICVQVEDEIQTLTQVLAAKEKQLAQIKRQLGITPLDELKQNITKTWQEVTTSTA